MKYLKFYESWILKPEQVNQGLNTEDLFFKYVQPLIPEFDRQYKDKYDNDDDSFEEVIKVLESKCKPFLDELRESKQYPLFRGARFVTDGNTPGLYHKTSYKDRIPTDMDKEISGFFDSIFIEKFGIRIRSNGVFASKCPVISSDYGTRYLFFPIGEYSYYWSPQINDLYGDCQYEPWYYDYSAEGAWDDTYGEFNNGVWSINGIEYNSDQKDSVKDAKDSDPTLKGLSNDKVSRMLVWIPDVTYDDFIIKIEDQAKREILRIANTYKQGELPDIEKQEITFICKEYFLVDVAFYSNFLKYLDLKSSK